MLLSHELDRGCSPVRPNALKEGENIIICWEDRLLSGLLGGQVWPEQLDHWEVIYHLEVDQLEGSISWIPGGLCLPSWLLISVS